MQVEVDSIEKAEEAKRKIQKKVDEGKLIEFARPWLLSKLYKEIVEGEQLDFFLREFEVLICVRSNYPRKSITTYFDCKFKEKCYVVDSFFYKKHEDYCGCKSCNACVFGFYCGWILGGISRKCIHAWACYYPETNIKRIKEVISNRKNKKMSAAKEKPNILWLILFVLLAIIVFVFFYK